MKRQTMQIVCDRTGFHFVMGRTLLNSIGIRLAPIGKAHRPVVWCRNALNRRLLKEIAHVRY